MTRLFDAFFVRDKSHIMMVPLERGKRSSREKAPPTLNRDLGYDEGSPPRKKAAGASKKKAPGAFKTRQEALHKLSGDMC